MKYKGLMARALYDNVPESPEELAFRKGDILTVLEQNTGGLEGWWLCSLHGRQGIAPGNRLKLLVGPAPESQPFEADGLHHSSARQEGLYQVPQGQDVYQVPQGQDIYQVPQGQDVYQVPQSSVRALEGLPSKVVTPLRVGQSYAFDPSQRQQDLYDTPPVRPQGVYDIPLGKQLEPAFPGQQWGPRSQGVYDVPPAMQGVYSIPPCRDSPAPPEGSYDFPQPHRPRPDDMYDVPPAAAVRPSMQAYRSPAPSSGGSGGIYDIPPSQQPCGGQRDVYDIPRGVPPPKSWDVVDGLQGLSLSSNGPPQPVPKGRESRPQAEEGGHGTDVNTDSTRPFPVPWGLEQEKAFGAAKEQCVKSWMEDYDYVHLQGKEEFERQQKELLEKENIAKQAKIHMEQEQLNQFKRLEQEVIRPVEVTKPVENEMSHCISWQHPPGSAPGPIPLVGGAAVCGRDRQLLHFYSEQCEAHFETLLNAVDAFFACVRGGQPPRVFVAHSKLVILSAHKLIFIGDTLARQATSQEVMQRMMDGSNTLCQMLKTVVEATKMAALRYPNTAPLQEMVDRVALLSHHAQQFQAQLLHMANV